MTTSQGSKRYEQPYSSRHVIHNTTDSIRADEPTYIRSFPRFLNSIFKKQTPFTLVILAHIRTPNATFYHETRPTIGLAKKSVTPRSPDTPTLANKQIQQGFKTIGSVAHKSPTPPPAQMTAVPSDFEHIYHYSEA